MYVIGLAAAVLITIRRWEAAGGSRALVYDVAMWGFPAGLIGGRLYFDLTSSGEVPPHWWGPFAVWDGGMGIWGGIALGAAVGLWRLRRAGVSPAPFMDAAAPALLVGQAIGRIGNYFNQELFGGPTSLPWALQISPAHRPAGYRGLRHLPPHLSLRADLEPRACRLPRLARPPPPHPPTGPLRPLRRRLLGLPDLRGVAPRRPGPPLPRSTAQLLRCDAALPRRLPLVREESGLEAGLPLTARRGPHPRRRDRAHVRMRRSGARRRRIRFSTRSVGGSGREERAGLWRFNGRPACLPFRLPCVRAPCSNNGRCQSSDSSSPTFRLR